MVRGREAFGCMGLWLSQAAVYLLVGSGTAILVGFEGVSRSGSNHFIRYVIAHSIST